jgi:hypothetical protein
VPPGWEPPAPTQVGYALIGTLTASGVTGGFHVGIYPADNQSAGCAGLEPPECTEQRLPDGSILTVGEEAHEAPGGVTYRAEITRPGDVSIELFVSNDRSTKGSGELIAPQPPLTLDQLVEIVTSDRW